MGKDREPSSVLDVSFPKTTTREKPTVAKQVDVKALREQAKTKRSEVAAHRANLTVANKELRTVQISGVA